MHAQTLKHLSDKLGKAKKVLDIGTGSGFIAAAMALMCPVGGRVYAVDHISEINEFAKSNIKKICPYLLKKQKIVFVT
jgi:protein-L-isoaspartate(D-aspartate) O-methyltransferase